MCLISVQKSWVLYFFPTVALLRARCIQHICLISAPFVGGNIASIPARSGEQASRMRSRHTTPGNHRTLAANSSPLINPYCTMSGPGGEGRSILEIVSCLEQKTPNRVVSVVDIMWPQTFLQHSAVSWGSRPWTTRPRLPYRSAHGKQVQYGLTPHLRFEERTMPDFNEYVHSRLLRSSISSLELVCGRHYCISFLSCPKSRSVCVGGMPICAPPLLVTLE